MSKYLELNSQSGITLVELIVSIVVVAVAVSGVLLAVQFTTRHSADPMLRQQAVAIADAYMQEILLKPYSDPQGGETGSEETGESRAVFDDVYDYKGNIKNEQPRGQTNSSMAGLENYLVSVKIQNATHELGPGSEKLAQSAKVAVTVSHASADIEFTLTAYKARY